MTSNRLPKWQQALNQKLVQRLNEPLTEPGIINNQMARKIIDRSPDLLARLPLLAQQMQRWSTIVDLQSEQTPIVYVQHQEAKQNPSLPSSDPNPGKKQLPVVKAKLVQSSASSPDGDKKQPLVDVRSQPTASALTQDNSDITAITPLISVTPIAENLANLTSDSILSKAGETGFLDTTSPMLPESVARNPVSDIGAISEVNPIQRKLDGASSSESASLNIDSEIPVVYERSQTALSEAISEQPLVNLSKPLANSSTEINHNPSISVTEIVESLANPIQRKLDSTPSLSADIESAKVDSEMPVVYERSQTALSEAISEQPLVNLSKPLANSSTEINHNPSISVTEIVESLANPIQRKLDSTPSLSADIESAKVDSEMPVVYERSQTALPEAISEQPLVNLSKPIASSLTEINHNPSISVTEIVESSANPIQRKLDSTPSLSSIESAKVDSEMPVVYERSQSTVSETISEQPLVNLSKPIASSLTKINQNPSISVTEIVESSANAIQRKLDSTPSLSSIESAKVDSEMPVVYERSQSTLSETISEQPLVNLSKPIASSSTEINQNPSISVTEIAASSANPIQRKLDSAPSLSSESISLTSEMPVVYQRLQPTLSETISEQPLVNLSKPIASSPTEINQNPSISVTEIASSSAPIQRKLDSAPSVSSESVSLTSEMPVVALSDTISEKPVVKLSKPSASSPTDINPPAISVTPISESSSNPIQRRVEANFNLPVVQVNSEQLSPTTEFIKLDPESPVVYDRFLRKASPTQPILSDSLPDKPLVNLSNNISQTGESLATEMNNPTSPPAPVVPISQISTRSIQRRYDNSAIVYSQPLSPKLPATEPTSLSQQLERNNFSVVSKQVNKISESPMSNPESYNLPVVEVNYERSPPEFEPLILSVSPIAKQKASSLNSEGLSYQQKNIAAANYNGTSSTHQPTSTTHSNSSIQATTIASTSSPNSQLPKVNQTTQTSMAGVNLPPQIDVDALAEKVERKIMRRLVVESERRGKKKWR